MPTRKTTSGATPAPAATTTRRIGKIIEDPELIAQNAVLLALQPHDRRTRQRVLSWATERLLGEDPTPLAVPAASELAGSCAGTPAPRNGLDAANLGI